MRNTKLIWVEDTELTGGMSVKKHSHEFYHLFYVLYGSLDFELNDSLLRLNAGDTVIALPGAAHRIPAPDSRVRLLEIKFGSASEALLEDTGALDYPIKADAHEEHLIKRIVEYGRSKQDFFIDSTQSYLETLMFLLTSGLHSAQSASAGSHIIDTRGFSSATVDIIMYIEEHYAKKLTLDELAEAFDYNKSYLCTSFKKDTGMTIIDFLNYVRIRHAAEHFSYSDVPLATVCDRVGFNNISHFNHVFKRLTGMPPSRYKRMFPIDMNGEICEGAASGDAHVENSSFSAVFQKLIEENQH